MNFDGDVALADKQDHHVLNDIDPNLKDFFGRGGKLLMYHGWSDQLIAPLNTVNYYESVRKSVGVAKSANSVRLLMFPGMVHCGGGEEPNRFDPTCALVQWVERGEVPDRMMASHFTTGVVDRTAPPLRRFANEGRRIIRAAASLVGGHLGVGTKRVTQLQRYRVSAL